jgi:hypothetical protein
MASLSIKSRVAGKLIDTVIADAEVADVCIYCSRKLYRRYRRGSWLGVEICTMVEMLFYDRWDGMEKLAACSTDVVEVGHFAKCCDRGWDLERDCRFSCR